MSLEILLVGLVVPLILYISAPYWWRSGWWRMPRNDLAAPLRERVEMIERQIAELEFDAGAGKMSAADLESSRARRLIERDRLLRQLERLGGMLARPLPPPIRRNRRCEECGNFCQAGYRFCAECGTPLKPRPVILSTERAKLARGKIIRLN